MKLERKTLRTMCIHDLEDLVRGTQRVNKLWNSGNRECEIQYPFKELEHDINL